MHFSQKNAFIVHMSELLGNYEDYEKPLQEKCGIVTIFAPDLPPPQKTKLGLVAAGGVQNRGQHGAGFVYHTSDGFQSVYGNGLLLDIMTPDITDKISSSESSIYQIHCRYATNGDYGEYNLQPIIMHMLNGEEVSAMHNGQFIKPESIAEKLHKPPPYGASDTYLFTQLLAESEEKNNEDRVMQTLRQVNGAYCLSVAMKDEVYLARDEFGLRPMVLGKVGDNGWIAASETFALQKAGIPVIREVKRGEVLKINNEGLKVIQEGKSGSGNFCELEWAYFSRPETKHPTFEREEDSQHPERWLSTMLFRERCGIIAAKEHPIPQADYVVGAPDSGLQFAQGVAIGSGLPYRQVIIRDHYDPNGRLRLFQRDEDINAIDAKVFGKLSLVDDPRLFEGKTILFADDSQIRSKVSRAVNQMLRKAGAKEIHNMFGFPPVIKTCHLGTSMRTEQELIAARLSSDYEKIAQETGADSVYYISHQGFIRARLMTQAMNLPEDPKDIFLENGGCGGCLTGRYPISQEGEIYHAKNRS